MTPENHSLHQTSISLSGNHSDQTVLCLFKTPNTLLVLGHPWLSNIIPRLTDWSMTSIWSSFFLSVSSELSHCLLTLVLTLILLNRLSSQQSLSSQWTMFYTFMGSPWPSSLTKNLSLHLECGRCSAQVLVPSWASPQVSTPKLTAKRKHKLGIGSNRPVCHFLKPVHVEHTTYLDKIYPQFCDILFHHLKRPLVISVPLFSGTEGEIPVLSVNITFAVGFEGLSGLLCYGPRSKQRGCELLSHSCSKPAWSKDLALLKNIPL